MPAAYHWYPVVLRQMFQPGTASTMKAATKIATLNIWPHIQDRTSPSRPAGRFTLWVENPEPNLAAAFQ